MKVYQAIAKITLSLGKQGIAKERQGQNYKFRGIDDIYNALSSELANNKLCILPVLLERECVERTAKSGSALFYVTVKSRFDIVSAEDGSKHEVVTYGEAMDSSDKATNKAMSAAYKYMAFMTFCIPTEADNDTETNTHEVYSTLGADSKILANLIDLSQTPTELDEIIHSHANIIEQLKNEQPAWHEAMLDKINHKRSAVTKSKS